MLSIHSSAGSMSPRSNSKWEDPEEVIFEIYLQELGWLTNACNYFYKIYVTTLTNTCDYFDNLPEWSEDPATSRITALLLYVSSIIVSE